MASQIAHIVYAQEYLKKYNSNSINPKEFILGSVFPDIRRVDKIAKIKDTHKVEIFGNRDLNFSGLNSFEAGWKFHLYCEVKREEILKKYNFYGILGTKDFEKASSKLLEDEIVFSLIRDKNIFNNLDFNKLKNEFSSIENTIKWYDILKKYLDKKPDNNSMRSLLVNLSTKKKRALEIIEKVEKLRHNDEVLKILKKVNEEII